MIAKVMFPKQIPVVEACNDCAAACRPDRDGAIQKRQAPESSESRLASNRGHQVRPQTLKP
jgi:hypothetical protein